MPLYRKKKGQNVWHWCTACPEYPTSDYEVEFHSYPERPTIGKFCEQCMAREKAGTCH